MNFHGVSEAVVPTGYLYLDIMSEHLDVDDVSRMLELEYSSVSINTRAGCDHWNYGFREQELYHFGEMQKDMVATFKYRKEALTSVARKYNAVITLTFVAYHVIDCLIGFHFDREFIDLAHDIGAEIDIDSYFKTRASGEAAPMSDEQELILIKKL